MKNTDEIRATLARLHRLLEQRAALDKGAGGSDEAQAAAARQALECLISGLVPEVESILKAQHARIDDIKQARNELAKKTAAGHLAPEEANREGRRLQEAMTEAQDLIGECQAALKAAGHSETGVIGVSKSNEQERRLFESRIHLFCIGILTAATVFLPWLRPGPNLGAFSLYEFGPWFAAEMGAAPGIGLTWLPFALFPMLAAAAGLATGHRRAGYAVNALAGLCLVLYLAFVGLYLGHPEGARAGIGGAFRIGGISFCLGAALLIAHGMVRQRWPASLAWFGRLRWLSGLYVVLVIVAGVWHGLTGGGYALSFSTEYNADEHQVVTTMRNTGRETVLMFLPWPEGAAFRDPDQAAFGGLIRVHDEQSGAYPIYPETREAWSAPGHPLTEEGAVELPPGGTLNIVIDLDALQEAGVHLGALRVEYTDWAGRRIHGVEVSGAG